MTDAGQLAELHQFAALGRLLADVAHEISTPLASLASNNEVLRRSLDAVAGEPLPAAAARRVAALQELAASDRIACERVAGLLRGLRLLTRTGDSAPARADVNELLRDALRLVHHQFRGRVEVETDLGELPVIECQPHALGQVFLNLLVNAGQAIEQAGKVIVRSHREPDAVHVSISDTGRGIAPDHRDRIFTPGFTTKPPGAGTGLGLALSREIAERHGGTLTFESAPGGTTFHVRIPIPH